MAKGVLCLNGTKSAVLHLDMELQRGGVAPGAKSLLLGARSPWPDLIAASESFPPLISLSIVDLDTVVWRKSSTEQSTKSYGNSRAKR